MLSIDLNKIMFHLEFENFSEYIEFMEIFLEKEAIKEEEKFKEILSAMKDPEDIILFQTSTFPIKVGEFAGILRNSFFISLFSYFENKLISECRKRKTEDILLDLNDIRASDDIERVVKYFKKVLKIKFPNNTNEWKMIQNYRLLRNCIVHAQSKINEVKDSKNQIKLREYISKESKLTLHNNNVHIYIERGFCEEACKTIENFLMLLLFPQQTEEI